MLPHIVGGLVVGSVIASAKPLNDDGGLPAVARHNRVRVPDGRVGEVIGFYRTEDEHMLVLLDTGGSKRYPRADLRLLR